MTNELEKALEESQKTTMTPEQKEAQRRSFVYGNTKIENEDITRETVNEVADALANGSRVIDQAVQSSNRRHQS
jgi:hypothetical protein